VLEFHKLAVLFQGAAAVTGPAFALVVLGLILRRLQVIGDKFIDVGSRLVFQVGMPVVLYFGALSADYSRVFSSSYLLAGLLATTLTVGLSLLYARLRGFPVEHHGIFVQGAYRSNMGIIGLALCVNAYGDEGLALAALPVAIWTIYYNVLAVLLLNSTLGKSRSSWGMVRGMLTNPLILGIFLGVLTALSGVKLPAEVHGLGSLFSSVTIPFALLCIGGALNLAVLRQSGRETLEASIWKLILVPLLSVSVALLMGVRGAELAVLFLLLGAPTASASFVMVVAVGGNGALAANIIVLTTMASVFTVTLGLLLLQYLGLV
jgi:predicted permease